MRYILRNACIGYLICILSVHHLAAQEYYFRHYEVVDGLSHNTVHCSVQDHKGFMWLGTKNGLNRFDGRQFKIHQSAESDSLSLGSSFIECLDYSNEKLWVGTDNGLYYYDLILDHFHLLEGTDNSPILDVENDLGGNLWYVSNNTLFRHHKKTQKTTEYARLAPSQVEEITMSSNGDIWVSSSQKLFKYNPEEDTFSNYPLSPQLDNDLPFVITKIFAINDQTMAIGTMSHGAFLFDIPNRSLFKLESTADKRIYVRDFLKKDNHLWIATESGIFIYHLISKSIRHLKKDFNDPYSLSDNAVYCLTMDQSGGIWAGTYFGGLNYFTDHFTTFKKYFPKVNENSISGEAVREIKQDDSGKLWIGTEDAGLNRLDPQTGTFRHYQFENTELEGIQQNIHGILPLGDEIWVGTFQNGLFVLDKESGQVIKQFKAGEKSGLRSNFIVTLYQSHNKNVYVLTSLGVHLYNEQTGRFNLFEDLPVNYFYTSFLEDSQGGLWAGTYWDGLYYFNPATGKKKTFKKEKYDAGSLSSNAINGIFEDSKGQIWITTENGLNLLRPLENEFIKYTNDDGFPSNVFYTVLEDDKKSLWMTTANGLVHYLPEKDQINIYTKEYGLLNNQFNYNSAYKAPDGQLFFGTVKGMISFNPYSDNFDVKNLEVPIVLTGFQINNQEVAAGEKNTPLSKSITNTKTVELKYDQSSFSIEFGAIDFDRPSLIKYAYKLDVHDEWIEIGNNNQIFFTELTPGTHTLFLKSLFPNGDWSKAQKVLEINISPPFWASRIAYLIYIGFGVLSLFFIIRIYHQRIEAKNAKKVERYNNAKEKEIYRAKIEFFTNISHEILTPLTLIKSPLEKLVKNVPAGSELKENLSIMYKNTARLLDLVQQLLDFRKTEMERVELTFVNTNMTELMKNIIQRFEPSIIDKNISLSHNLQEDDIFAFVDVEAVKKIISNLVKNAIKYGHQKMALHLKNEGDFMELRIKNDGNLIPPSLRERIFEPFYRLPADKDKSGSGIGLSLAYSLTELHKGTLKLDLGDSTMNTFVLRLPIHQKNEFKLYPSNKWVTENGKSIHTQPTETQQYRSAILLVEDNQDLLDFVAKDLMNDYLVLKASNAEQAFEIIENESIQLIVSDVMMPGMNGFEMCEKIKTDIKYSHIPIILLTSKTALNDKIEGLEAGADAYIAKPFSMDYLKIQISNLLKNRQHIVEHFSSSPLAHIRSIVHTKTDEDFIKKLDEIIHQNISDPNLNVEFLAEIMNMSRSTLYRKIKDMTNLSPKELINLTRLKKAAELLKTNQYKVYEVSYMVGFNSPTIFGRNFQKQFDMTPTEYVLQK
jgi:ligand-binding sensor domain-containing protein/signal transduction histidine kinase/DNA-binding response OmpR family regulator